PPRTFTISSPGTKSPGAARADAGTRNDATSAARSILCMALPWFGRTTCAQCLCVGAHCQNRYPTQAAKIGPRRPTFWLSPNFLNDIHLLSWYDRHLEPRTNQFGPIVQSSSFRSRSIPTDSLAQLRRTPRL